MGCLRFNPTGGADWLRWQTIAAALGQVPTAAFTIATTYKPFSSGAQYNGLLYLCTAAPLTRAGLSRKGTTNNVFMDAPSGTASFEPAASYPLNDTAEEYIGVTVKASGTVTPQFYRYRRSVDQWEGPSAASEGVMSPQTAGTLLEVATWQGGGDLMDGWLAVQGIWDTDLTTLEVQSLSQNWRTSDWVNLAPLYCCEYNVAAASLVDLMGGASNLLVTGAPTLDAGETFDSWNFDGTGGPPAPPAAVQVPAYDMRGFGPF